MAETKKPCWKQSLCFMRYNLQRSLFSPKYIMILLIMIIHIIWMANWARDYMVEKGQSIQFLEFYTMVSNDAEYYFYLTIALIFLLSDCPFDLPGTESYLLRSNRSSWFFGQIFYILTIVVLLNVFLMVLCSVCLLPHVTFGNEWSIVIKRSAIMHGDLKFDMAFPGFPMVELCELSKHLSPLATAGITFAFNLLWMTVLGMLSLGISLYSQSRAGFIAVGGVITFHRIVAFYDLPLLSNTMRPLNFIYLSQWVTRWYDTRFYDQWIVTFGRWHRYSPKYAVVFFLVLLAVSFFLGLFWAKRYDFSQKSG